MFIFFGWRKKTIKDYGDTLPLTCENCHNDVFFKLIRTKTWFTLFFIPVIPYDSKSLLMCDICKSGYEMKGEKVQRAKVLNEHTTSYKNKTISNEEYQGYINKANLFGRD